MRYHPRTNVVEDSFRDWLEHLDLITGYEWRYAHPVRYWRKLFERGVSCSDAVSIAYGE